MAFTWWRADNANYVITHNAGGVCIDIMQNIWVRTCHTQVCMHANASCAAAIALDELLSTSGDSRRFSRKLCTIMFLPFRKKLDTDVCKITCKLAHTLIIIVKRHCLDWENTPDITHCHSHVLDSGQCLCNSQHSRTHPIADLKPLLACCCCQTLALSALLTAEVLLPF